TKQQGLLLQRHTVRRKGRLHDGKVVVMRSNLRWCSDVFETTCWNGGMVRIAGWFDDYNESHPHSGLGMISPKEFIRAPVRWPGVRSTGGNTTILLRVRSAIKVVGRHQL